MSSPSSESSKKFGSLRKQTGDSEGGGSSLDRKYLGFLGRGSAVPVPTAQFRSYRRVAPPLPRSLHQSAESVLTLDSRYCFTDFTLMLDIKLLITETFIK